MSDPGRDSWWCAEPEERECVPAEDPRVECACGCAFDPAEWPSCPDCAFEDEQARRAVR